MSTDHSVNPAEFLVDFSKFDPEYDYREIIGRQQYLDIALSAATSPDMRLGGRYCRNNPAYLFSGQEGSGRRTLEVSIGLMMLDMVIQLGEPESNFRWYLLPEGALLGDNANEICGNINALFDAVEADMQNDDYFVLLSLSRLSPVVRKKRAARLLAKRLDSVITSEQSCLVTASFDEDLQKLPEELRSQFQIMKLTAPDYNMRVEYLEAAASLHPMVVWEMPVYKIAEQTEGFTFGMLKGIVNMIFSLATGMIIGKGSSVEDYLFITNNPPLVIPAQRIAFIIENAAVTMAKSEKQSEIIRVVENIAPVTVEPQQEKKAEQQDESESRNPDTPSEMERILQTLTMPLMLNH